MSIVAIGRLAYAATMASQHKDRLTSVDAAQVSRIEDGESAAATDDREDREIGRCIVGAVGLVAEGAGRAVRQHLEKATEQSALAAARAEAAPAAPQRGSQIYRGGGGIWGGTGHAPTYASD